MSQAKSSSLANTIDRLSPDLTRRTMFGDEPSSVRLAPFADTTKQVKADLRRVDPSAVRIWARASRDYDRLTEQSCKELIESILATGGQEFPCLVRETPDDPAYDFEVFAGFQRHWAISWLRANGHPDIEFFVEVRNVSDEEAFRLSMTENGGRKDLSFYEYGITFKWAAEAFFDGKAYKLAEAIGRSSKFVSRCMVCAKVPIQIVDAFPTIDDFRYLHAKEILEQLSNAKSSARVLREATRLQLENNERKLEGKPPPSAKNVCARLVNAGRNVRRVTPQFPQSFGGDDLPHVVVKGRSKTDLSLSIPLISPETDLQDVVRSVEAALKAHGLRDIE